MTLGERIKTLRQEQGLSQEVLAERLGVSRQAVSKWEKDLSRPDTENLISLARIFDVSADDLAGLSRAAREDASAQPKKRRRTWLVILIIVLVLALLLVSCGVINYLNVRRSGTANAGEFSVMWDDGEKSLSLGDQEGFFPYGTGLVKTAMEKVEETDFRSMTLHTAQCGGLEITYLHIEDEEGERENVTNISTIAPGYTTPAGIGVGSGAMEVLSAYGGEVNYCLKESGADILCVHDWFYAYSPEEALGNAILFYIRDGSVAGLRLCASGEAGAWAPDNISRFPIKDGQPDFSRRKEPERDEIDVNREVYISLFALKNDKNLSAEDVYRHRRVIFENLQKLDWQSYGLLGEAGYEDETRLELTRWLSEQDTLSLGEIDGLLLGACRSNLDGFLTDSYCTALYWAFVSYPEQYVKRLSGGVFTDDERRLLVNLTAYGCGESETTLQNAQKAAETVTGDPLRYTETELFWCDALAEAVREQA